MMIVPVKPKLTMSDVANYFVSHNNKFDWLKVTDATCKIARKYCTTLSKIKVFFDSMHLFHALHEIKLSCSTDKHHCSPVKGRLFIMRIK